MRLKDYTLLTVFIVLFNACNTNNTSNTERIKNPNGRNDVWEHVGAGGGGAMFGPAISPHDPDVAFVACDMGGCYATYDGGKVWRMFNLSEKVTFYVFDPLDPDVVYANMDALAGMYKSTDKGNTWRLFYPKPTDVLGLVSKGDHARERWVPKDNILREVRAFAIDPANSKKMYAAIQDESTIALYVSDNGGEGWTKERVFADDVTGVGKEDWKRDRDLTKDVKKIFIDPSSPADNRTIYVAFQDWVEQKVDGMWTRYYPEEGLKFSFYTGGYDESLKKYIMYAIAGPSYYTYRYRINVTKSGIYYSEDGGKT